MPELGDVTVLGVFAVVAVGGMEIIKMLVRALVGKKTHNGPLAECQRDQEKLSSRIKALEGNMFTNADRVLQGQIANTVTDLKTQNDKIFSVLNKDGNRLTAVETKVSGIEQDVSKLQESGP